MTDRPVLHSDQPEIPIACALTPGELEDRGRDIGALFSRREETRELPDGYALRFAGDPALAPKLLDIVLAERACCPFFTFELRFDPGEGPIWLNIRGPEGAKDLMSQMLG
jgi:hypothetical protein